MPKCGHRCGAFEQHDRASLGSAFKAPFPAGINRDLASLFFDIDRAQVAEGPADDLVERGMDDHRAVNGKKRPGLGAGPLGPSDEGYAFPFSVAREFPLRSMNLPSPPQRDFEKFVATFLDLLGR